MESKFQDGSLMICPFSATYKAALYFAVRESLAELCKWMTWCSADYSPEQAEAFVAAAEADWARGSSYCFAIVDTESGMLAGSVGLTYINRNHNFANMGIWVRASKARRGIATKATRLVARFAFEELRLSRLEIVVAQGNQPSRRVAEKAGAKSEGLLRNRIILSGKLHDAVMFSLLPLDLQAAAAIGANGPRQLG